MTAPAGLRPVTDVVAPAWFRLYQPLRDSGAIIATKLPVDNEPLRKIGAIRLRVVGGAPDEVGMRHPVVTAECWAAPPEGSQKLPWNRAGALAEWCWEASMAPDLRGVTIEFPPVPGYDPARVSTVVALSEPVRVETDPNFARFDLDLQFHWTIGV